MSLEAELAEAWLLLGRREGEGERIPPPLASRRARRAGEEATLEQVGRWWHKTRHLVVKVAGRRGRRVAVARREEEEVRRAARRAVVRWGRLGREGRRRNSLRSLMVREWGRLPSSLPAGELVAVLCHLGRRGRREAARREEEQMEEQRRDYKDYLDSEVTVTVEEGVGKEEEEEEVVKEEVEAEVEEQPDYSSDEAVLDHIREKEKTKRGTSGQVTEVFLLYLNNFHYLQRLE